MRTRVTAGIGAWIVGAATATGLSLFAVSFLIEDPQSPQGATLSQAQVNQALTSMAGTAGATTAPAVSTPPGSVSTEPTTSAPSTPASPTKPGPSGSTAPAVPAPSPSGAQPVDRRLSGDAGSVVAQCQGSTVYLVTWSPAQGYQAEVPQRGPAHQATVVFTGYGNRVAFHISCPGGTPALVEDDDHGDYR